MIYLRRRISCVVVSKEAGEAGEETEEGWAAVGGDGGKTVAGAYVGIGDALSPDLLNSVEAAGAQCGVLVACWRESEQIEGGGEASRVDGGNDLTAVCGQAKARPYRRGV